MFVPLGQLIERVFIVHSVAKDTNLGLVEEKMGQVVHILITCCVPNVQFKLVSLIGVVLDTHHFFKVLDHIRAQFVASAHRAILNKGIDD